MPPEDKPKSEAAEILPLDEITDKSKRRQVEAYFKDKKDVLDAAKGQRGKLQEVVRKMNRAKAGPDQIIEAIVNNIFASNLDRNVRGKYAKEFVDEIIEQNINLVGDDDTVEELNANPVCQKARAKVLAVIKNGIQAAEKERGKFLKPKYADKYATAVCEKFVKDMDEEITGRVSAENVKVDLTPMTFNDWVAAHPENTDDTLFYSLNLAEAKEFVAEVSAVKSAMAPIDLKVKDLDKRLVTYFQGGMDKLNDEILARPVDPEPTIKAAKALAASYAVAMNIVKHQTDIKKRLQEIAELKKKQPDFDPTIEADYKKIEGETNKLIDSLIEKKGKGELAINQKAFTDLNKKFDAAKKQAAAPKKKPDETTDAAEGASEAEPDLMTNPEGFLEKIGKEGGPIMSLVMAFFVGSPMFAKFKKFIGKFKNKTDVLKMAPRLNKFRDFLKKQDIEMKGDESAKVSQMELSKVLKMSRSPSGVGQKGFDALKVVLNENGAKKSTKGTVMEFLETKYDNAKKIPAKTPKKKTT